MLKSLIRNKKNLTLIAGLGLILLLTPFYFAEAVNIYTWCECTINPACWLRCFVETLLSIPIRIIFTVIVGINGILALLAGLVYALTVSLVNWFLQIIMSVGVTPNNPLTPEIIRVGWTFTRDLANLFFILALVFIGLATVLRIKEYEMKKALPTLIIIALLINFTPVIVGFIVDMGNILTAFFLGLAGGVSSADDIMAEAWGYLPEAMKLVWTTDGKFFSELPRTIAILMTVTVYGLCLLIFFSVGIFIYILIAAVFFCRTLILWVLMILSPIAFLSKVFPDTRTTKMIFPDILHWDKWWQSLIQWTIIGIPIGFFLWLSNSIMFFYKADIESKFGIDVMTASMQAASGYPYDPSFAAEVAVHEAQVINLISMMLAPTVALFLLIMGALISLKAVPDGAQGIMRFTHEKAKGIPRLAIGGAKSVRREFTDMRQYMRRRIQEGRALGLSKPRATGEALRRYLKRRITPSPAPITIRGKQIVRGRPAQVARVIGALGGRAAIGVLRATKDMATQKIGKEMKAKKGKGEKTCSNPTCRESIDADARFCKHCGQAQP